MEPRGTEEAMTPGIITQLLPARRLGFVRPAVGGIPLLFNAAAVEEVSFEDLREGQAVTYSLERDRLGRGARAIHVRPTDSSRANVPLSAEE
jgi:cold shock CspA family protein